jgi:signal transduction histidine kinase
MAQKITPDGEGSRNPANRGGAPSKSPAQSADSPNSPSVTPYIEVSTRQTVSDNSLSNSSPRLFSDSVPAPSMAEFEETLKRLVDRIAKILQAEKCVFMLHDTVAGTLYPTLPAIGIDSSQFVNLERRVSDDGITSEVFRTNTPVILYDAAHDPRATAEDLPAVGVRNGVSVPLVIEKRDDQNQNRVTERTIVGVLHVFNKKSDGQFVEEDVRLLQRMAMTAAAVFSSTEMYREAVQEKQELIHTIDSLMAGLLLVGSNGRLLQINPSARAILKINPNIPLVGVPYHRAIPNDRVRSLLDNALTSGIGEVADEITVKMRRDAANGRGGESTSTEEKLERIFQVQCAPVRDGQGAPAGVVAIFNDITEIRNVERMKDDFLSTVSHELRTPLTSIKGFVSTLLTDIDGFFDAEQRREFYEIMDTECDRLTRLIDDLLNISRIEQGRAMQINWEPVDLVSIARKIVTTQLAIARNHELVVDFPDNFPEITGDPDKLGQVLTNLVDNAIKYSPKGGKVLIAGAVLSIGPGKVSISISDEGIGVSPEHLPRLFDRFYRVDNRDNREIGGTGIGLALVKALVEAHHGTVDVESEPGQGSTFTVTLPIEHRGARPSIPGKNLVGGPNAGRH